MHCLLFLQISLVFSSVSLSSPGEQLMFSTFSNTYAKMKKSHVINSVSLSINTDSDTKNESFKVENIFEFSPLNCFQPKLSMDFGGGLEGFGRQ